MLILANEVPRKPFMSYAMVQGREADTIRVKGHTSMRAAKRAVGALKRRVQDAAEAELDASGRVLMAWGYAEVRPEERVYGIVL